MASVPAVSEFASRSDGPVVPGTLFPFLFVTIACGACSGFHGLVCSGTTSVPTYNVTGTNREVVQVIKTASLLNGSNGGTLAFNRSDIYVFSGEIEDDGGDAGKVVQMGTGTTVLTAYEQPTRFISSWSSTAMRTRNELELGTRSSKRSG